MTTTATRIFYVGVIERAITYYEVEAEDARTAADNWQDGAFWDRDDEALDAEGPCSVRALRPDGTWLAVPETEWEAAADSGSDPSKQPYSVLLLYPDDANDSGAETYYAFVEAADPLHAVALAQSEAAAAQQGIEIEPDDFMPLLVTQAHNASLPLFNK
jgi:hypothetical protein